MPRKTYEEIKAEIAEAKAAGMIWNVDFKDLKDSANSMVWREYMDTLCGKVSTDGLPEKVQKLTYSIPHGTHGMGGWLKKAKAANCEGFAPYVAFAERWAPIEAGFNAIKGTVQKGRKTIPVTPEKLAAIEADAAARRTCQICDRKILPDADGKLAHHGYERPYGKGFHTASCYGARELKFETDRDVLRRYLDTVLIPAQKRAQELFDAWEAFTGPIWKTIDKENGQTVISRKEKPDDWQKLEPGTREWTKQRDIRIGTLRFELSQINIDLGWQTDRFDRWTKTED